MFLYWMPIKLTIFYYKTHIVKLKIQVIVIQMTNSRLRRRKLPVFKIPSKDQLEERGRQLVMLSLWLVSLDGYGHLS